MANSSWLSLSDALHTMLSAAKLTDKKETLALGSALGRVTATDIYAQVNVPPCNNSAMDGYALRSADGKSGARLAVTATVLAGDSHNPAVAEGQCVRIMTGAPVPADCDAVVIQENVRRDADTITLHSDVSPLDNIRQTGNDIAQGSLILARGKRLTPADLMLLSSMGNTHIEVYQQLNIGLLATGDELVAPGTPLQAGQIYESNRSGIAALLAPLNVRIKDYGIAPDEPETLKALLKRAQLECDIIISSGGVSVGDADFVKPVLDELGSIGFWKIAIKPGKPFAFGQLGNALFCGLPGNPVSAYVTTEQLVVPLLRYSQGESNVGNAHRLTLQARITQDIQRRAGRLDFQRAVFTQNADGTLSVTPLANQSSGVMTSFTRANCYMLIPADTATLNAGEFVDIQPFSVTSMV
ncbi:molybdopterin molybdotransferase MoeA [Alteromonas gilva]|uniref:Molybdopterin molybdenumtransferase n=1 Tax=Alteromonas gilva TaxID=2987522 RepID=A0ABT5L467_9ALTE|nr:gephyrin-like molybdotransferase Glp [Alteromonas gilva]MDC8831186.1 molybdopterin molybdotransferase MoeA [Alteromonas gilva]